MGVDIFSQGIVDLFQRMDEENLQEPDAKVVECQTTMKLILDRYGIMTTLSSLAGLLSNNPDNCPHMEWLSANLNVLVNGASEHQTEKHRFPFGD